MVARWFTNNAGNVLWLDADEHGTLYFARLDDPDLPPIHVDSLVLKALRAEPVIHTRNRAESDPILVALLRLARRGTVTRDGEAWRVVNS